MMNLLHTIGLMTRAEHERLTDELDNDAFASWNKAITDRDDMRMQRDDWQAKHASVCTKLNEMTAKFKRAATDLAAQAAHIEDWRAALERMETDRDNWRGQALRDAPDAEAMRKKRAADRKRMAGKRNG